MIDYEFRQQIFLWVLVAISSAIMCVIIWDYIQQKWHQIKKKK